MAGCVRYAESSMRNGFGLKLIYLFLNVPFLLLQRESLLKQLHTNEHHFGVTYTELDAFEHSDDCDYERFMDGLSSARREAAEQVAPKATAKIPESRDKPDVNTKQSMNINKPAASSSSPAMAATTPQTQVTQAVASIVKSSTQENLKSPAVSSGLSKVDVHNFEPDMNQDAEQFLGSPGSPRKGDSPEAQTMTVQADSDEEAENSMVTRFQEDIDSDSEHDQEPLTPTHSKLCPVPVISGKTDVDVVARVLHDVNQLKIAVQETSVSKPSSIDIPDREPLDACEPPISSVSPSVISMNSVAVSPAAATSASSPVPVSPDPVQITANELDNFFGFAAQPAPVAKKTSSKSKKLKSPRLSATRKMSSCDSENDCPNPLVTPLHKHVNSDTDQSASPPPRRPPVAVLKLTTEKPIEKEKKKKKSSDVSKSSSKTKKSSKSKRKEQLPDVLINTKETSDKDYEAF